jgi:hypothetical protein
MQQQSPTTSQHQQPSTLHDKAHPHAIFATVVSRQDDLVILRTENNQEIIWPKSKLPEGLRDGDEINLIASISPILELGKLDEHKAKQILEMMLNS